jgi:uncharacterized protein (TIGR03083 family)
MISALRSGYDDLSAYAAKLDEKDLVGPSGASDWTIAQVLSHLGSGAEITQATLERAVAGEGGAPDGFNQGVWARWDAMDPTEQRDAFLTANRSLVERYESLDEDTRNNLRVDLGFLPAPVGLAEAARLRLNEFALHAWDVKVAADPAATVAPEAVPLLLDAVAALLGFIAKADALGGRTATLAVEFTDDGQKLGLELSERVAVAPAPIEPDGTLRLPGEAWLRLLTGRLAPEHTPKDVTVEGPISLDDLRRVFPGF